MLTKLCTVEAEKCFCLGQPANLQIDFFAGIFTELSHKGVELFVAVGGREAVGLKHKFGSHVQEGGK